MDTFLNVAFDQPNEINYDNLNGNKLVISARDVVKKSHNIVVVWTLYIQRLTSIIQLAMRIFKINHFSQYLNNKLEIIIDEMVDGEKENKAKCERKKMIHSLMDLYREKKLGKNELMANTFFMLMAGWDTTSDSLTALMWRLASNRQIQEKLRTELMRDGIDSNYLQCVIRESLRLLPPATTAREIGEEFKWKNFTFMKGMVLCLNPYSMNRYEKLWGPDAEQFKPERYQEDARHPAQHATFGLGPRNCVGYHLAMLEMKMITSRLILNYDIRLCDSSPKKLSLKASKDSLFFVNILQDCVELELVPLRKCLAPQNEAKHSTSE